MAQVLLTSFEPFGGRRVNASRILAAAALDRLARGRMAARRRVVHACLPVDHDAAAAAVAALIDAHAPRQVVLTGEWSGSAVRLERHGRPGPLAPWRGGVLTPPPGPAPALFQRFGAAVRLSGDAGRYVCDTTFWAAAEACQGAVAVTFVHMPREATDPAAPRGRAIADGLAALLAA